MCPNKFILKILGGNWVLNWLKCGGLAAESCLTLTAPWLEAHQAPLCMGFSRQEHWSGLPFPSPGDLPDLGNEPGFPALQANSLLDELQGTEGKEG